MLRPRLQEILDHDLLIQHLANGVVRRQVHPLYPELFIYNYTEVAQYDRIWDNVTNVCRGLIVANDYVIARPFRKFHNLNTEYVQETLEANLPKDNPLVTEKLDGSMGIIYHWDHKWWVATRGSFASEQAKWATEWLRKPKNGIMSHHLLPELLVTPIVEIIYSENRIVVDYDYEGLVLLGLVWKNTGYEMSYLAAEEFARTHQFPLVRRFEKSLAECAGENENNAEGYVLTYPSTGLKVKVKFEEYVRLHRILTGLNPRAIWEMLVPPEMLQKSPQAAELNAAVAEKRLASVDSILGDPKMPTGFIAWFGGWVNYLRTEFARIEREAKAVFDNRPIIRPNNIDGVLELGERKTQALYFLQAPSLCGVLFAMLDGKGYDTIIWKSIKPRGDAESYKRDGE